ncbi:xanthine dehydrogenase accessory protein XdhC [Peteryoungia ipomoeae]|uniref:Xanthine dehydrogenase accessory protein XdhC n=1 Tax=Peteryoungia ipomoeae TaxID=1210932 RepID=A0A4S8P3Z8_9HYPH|nr:xanthine dehydrogenase accessory protein XdhC [Peteryoungia ipomoeae]THV24740.1 xanthine dehydrogenase accessory protein XdhC [Peteryoungia ipomoeae]
MAKTDFSEFLASQAPIVLVEIAEARGSTPRDAGTMMLVSPSAIWGTIGGGQLEFMAIENARQCLEDGGAAVMEIPLGPEIGQCCGGRTTLTFSTVTPARAGALKERWRRETLRDPSVYLFGAGHVGLALASALAPLPLSVSVVETRAEALSGLPPTCATRHVAMPEAVVAEIPPGGAAVILTHDHALDFLIAREALSRHDLGYVGMIGSKTKRATFAAYLEREGGDRQSIEKLVLPIGGSTVRDKRPEVIAAMVTAELLTTLL